jgi:cell wall-associated NlpC family hydrolase
MKAMLTLAAAAGLIAGCGQQSNNSTPDPNIVQQHAAPPSTPALHAHPQAVEPVAGAGGSSAAESSGSSNAPAGVSVGGPSGPLPQPVSDAEIRRELAASGLNANATQAALTTAGLAVSPVNAPPQVQAIIQAGNEIAHLPYVWGGGHARYIDTGYDCSGSISFVFGAAGILNTTMTSGELMSWGKPGPGKWITVFANNGHTFMYVAGLRFDTVALAQTGSRWSNRPANEPDLNTFVVRHPPGL